MRATRIHVKPDGPTEPHPPPAEEMDIPSPLDFFGIFNFFIFFDISSRKLLCCGGLYHFWEDIWVEFNATDRVTLSTLRDSGLVRFAQYGNTVEYLVYG